MAVAAPFAQSRTTLSLAAAIAFTSTCCLIAAEYALATPSTGPIEPTDFQFLWTEVLLK